MPTIGAGITLGPGVTITTTPGIVTSGLVLQLDAANTSSYPGSGTSWTDLSGLNNTFTLTGGVTFTSGYFTTFTEATNYFEIANTANVSNFPLGAADRTICLLGRTPTSYPAPFNHAFHYGTDAGDQSFGLAITQAAKLATHPWFGSPISNETIATGTDMMLSVSYTQSSSLHRFFQNNIELTSSNATRTINTGAGTKMARVGSRISTPAELWQTSGRIAVVLVYNRVLTLAEISQNYHALRDRSNI